MTETVREARVTREAATGTARVTREAATEAVREAKVIREAVTETVREARAIREAATGTARATREAVMEAVPRDREAVLREAAPVRRRCQSLLIRPLQQSLRATGPTKMPIRMINTIREI